MQASQPCVPQATSARQHKGHSWLVKPFGTQKPTRGCRRGASPQSSVFSAASQQQLQVSCLGCEPGPDHLICTVDAIQAVLRRASPQITLQLYDRLRQPHLQHLRMVTSSSRLSFLHPAYKVFQVSTQGNFLHCIAACFLLTV